MTTLIVYGLIWIAATFFIGSLMGWVLYTLGHDKKEPQ